MLRVQRTQPSPSKRIGLRDLFSLVDGPHGWVAQAPSDPSPLREHDSTVLATVPGYGLCIPSSFHAASLKELSGSTNLLINGFSLERGKPTRAIDDDSRVEQEAQALRNSVDSKLNSGTDPSAQHVPYGSLLGAGITKAIFAC